jgi:hypothetical protein
MERFEQRGEGRTLYGIEDIAQLGLFGDILYAKECSQVVAMLSALHPSLKFGNGGLLKVHTGEGTHDDIMQGEGKPGGGTLVFEGVKVLGHHFPERGEAQMFFAFL